MGERRRGAGQARVGWLEAVGLGWLEAVGAGAGGMTGGGRRRSDGAEEARRGGRTSRWERNGAGAVQQTRLHAQYR